MPFKVKVMLVALSEVAAFFLALTLENSPRHWGLYAFATGVGVSIFLYLRRPLLIFAFMLGMVYGMWGATILELSLLNLLTLLDLVFHTTLAGVMYEILEDDPQAVGSTALPIAYLLSMLLAEKASLLK